MKKLVSLTLIGVLAMTGVSCHTSYDAYGNPRQAVDPGVAVAGVAAAGVLAYAIGRDRNDDYNHGYYPRPGYHHQYRNPYCRY
jgi:hypothetical protein